MRILHCIATRGFYGAENVVLQLAAALRARGHVVSAALLTRPGLPPNPLAARLREAGVEAHVLSSGGRLDCAVVGRVRRLLRGLDVLHTHNYKSNLYGLLASAGLPTAALATCHNWTDATRAVRLYGRFDRRIVRCFDRVVAVSDSTAARLEPGFARSGRLLRIDNGIRTAPKRAAGGNDGLLIGSVARLSPEKGVDLLLEAAAELLPSGPQLRWEVAGDGPERGRLLQVRDRLGLAETAALRGFEPDVPGFLARLDIFVQPSRVDAMPMSVLEAMAAGLPVVAPRLGAIPALLGPNADTAERGLLFPPGDARAMAEAVRALARDPALRARLGAAAAAYVEKHCSADAMAARYESAYREALACRGLPLAEPARP